MLPAPNPNGSGSKCTVKTGVFLGGKTTCLVCLKGRGKPCRFREAESNFELQGETPQALAASRFQVYVARHQSLAVLFKMVRPLGLLLSFFFVGKAVLGLFGGVGRGWEGLGGVGRGWEGLGLFCIHRYRSPVCLGAE